MIRLIAFDLDGTLIDSRQDIADSANALLSHYGKPPLPQEIIISMVGEGARRLVARFLKAADVEPAPPLDEALPKFIELYEQRLVVHTRPYPGIPDALARLQRSRHLAVLTNKPRRAALEILDHFGLLDLFLDVIGGDGPLPRKPDPAALHALRARADADVEDTLLVGDSWVDVETARRAGVRAGLVTYGFGAPPAEGLRPGEIEIRQPSDLPDLVARLNGHVRGEPVAR